MSVHWGWEYQLHPRPLELKAARALAAAGADVIALVSLVDRRAGDVAFDVPYHALLDITFPTYAEDEIPPELAAVPVTKPGSRK